MVEITSKILISSQASFLVVRARIPEVRSGQDGGKGYPQAQARRMEDVTE